RRVVDRLDTVLTLEPDEPEHFRPRPASFAVQQVTEFGPTLEQPAAALGAFFEPAHEHRRLVIPGLTLAGICPWPGDVKQLAAEVANLLEPASADLLRLRPRSLSDPVSQPRRVADQVTLDGVAGLHVRDPLLDPVFQLPGIFMGQESQQSPIGGHPVGALAPGGC